ncbi:23S rRNA pseudouridine1911/1915/1917 synthase [Nonlabens dokdonensis]|uniref:Ribosomal large subunit pseudouridine synthase D n=2 Tax=Nonlabens dokdonensis TaxID=328515 RepID=L7W8L7_NONDD|nr:RNA pseudouridine synthase [Nonlabens dokdonensis]AGC78045.1 ribosomal large subunit pseudouridine synthase D [Nonlabens dokdonensis DSW-6]PZX37111.1 23S rRNA pseudouridine1911/1915/1917 synthase [Nonlabens dokdonensis]
MNKHNITNRILFEDNHLIAINKESGDLVQGDKTGDEILPDLIKDYIAKKYDKPGAVFLGVVHRLDRPTSGVVIFARTSKALPRMNKLFADHETNKTYWAIVEGKVPEKKARLEHFLVRNPKQNKSYAHDHEVPNSKKAALSYSVLKELNRYTLLEIQLETGRHHQIRTQLAKIGCVIKGDLKYGAKRSNKDGSIHLHARYLAFVHPVRKEPVKIIAPVNKKDAIWKLVANL